MHFIVKNNKGQWRGEGLIREGVLEDYIEDLL